MKAYIQKAPFLAFLYLFSFQAFGQLTIPAEIIYHIKEKNMQEISGLIADTTLENGNYTFWALADGGAPAKLYKYELKSVDSLIEKNQFEDTATLIDSTTFINAGNKDWEELTQSPNEVFIGDFGNNDGNRTDLKIFKFDRNDLGSQNIKVDTLVISYARQTDFSSQRFHAWDCEAMYWENDSLVLLSKGIANSRVYIYKFPDHKGSYALNPIDSFQSTQLITGASNYAGREISLVGYNFNSSLKLISAIAQLNKPFSNNWSSGINDELSKPYQVESITHQLDGRFFKAYATEAYDGKDARIFVEAYYGAVAKNDKPISVQVSPNPFKEELGLLLKSGNGGQVVLTDIHGKWIIRNTIEKGENNLDLTGLAKGIYILHVFVPGYANFTQKVIKE